MANKGNVGVGKPLVAGAVYRAPVGTTLPTAADAALDEAFVPVGYISEEGLRWSYSGDGDVIRAWGRDVVARPAGVVDDVASFQMLETVNEEAVRAFWGDDARSVISGGYALQVGVPSTVQYSWVIDMVLPTKPDPAVIWPNPRVRRIVIPAASVRDREEISYQDSELVAYGVSLKAGRIWRDASVIPPRPRGFTPFHYEYTMGVAAEIVEYNGNFHFHYYDGRDGDISAFDIIDPEITLGGAFLSGTVTIFKLIGGEWEQTEIHHLFMKSADFTELPVTFDFAGYISRGEIANHDYIKFVFEFTDIGTLETPIFEVIE